MKYMLIVMIMAMFIGCTLDPTMYVPSLDKETKEITVKILNFKYYPTNDKVQYVHDAIEIDNLRNVINVYVDNDITNRINFIEESRWWISEEIRTINN